MSSTTETPYIHQTRSQANDDGNYFLAHINSTTYLKHGLIGNYMIGEGEGVVLEDDSEDEEGYVFAGQGNFFDVFRHRVYIVIFLLESCC